MTIKEIEEHTGIPRANIRYYETEGLLSPSRSTNGYRDYSEADLETLLKIKLLRSIHVSMEDIKALQSGSSELTGVLRHHIQKLETEQKELKCSKEVCKVMRDEGAKYGTLNAQRYLDYMERSFKEDSAIFQDSVWETDIIPKENVPWRRYFARSLDMAIYGVVWNIFLMYVCNVNTQKSNIGLSIVGTIVILVLMLLVEPVLLSLFGTTLGKWVLGLHVANLEAEKPNYQESLLRTIQVIYYGLGASVPIVNWVCLYRNYKRCVAGEDMEWEYRSNVLHIEKGIREIVGYLFSYVCLAAVVLLATLGVRLPKNRGDITIAEFCDNFNQLAEYYQLFEDRELSESGEWKQEETSGTIVVYFTENWESPEFTFTEEGGVLTGVSFSESFTLPADKAGQRSAHGMLDFYQEEMVMAVLAYLPTREEYPILSDRAYEIADYILKNAYQDFSIEEYGVKISYDLEYTNFQNLYKEGFLIKLDDSVDAKCSFVFSMELQKD